MKHLSKVVNIIPVIAKADTMTLEEKIEFKQRVSTTMSVWSNSFTASPVLAGRWQRLVIPFRLEWYWLDLSDFLVFSFMFHNSTQLLPWDTILDYSPLTESSYCVTLKHDLALYLSQHGACAMIWVCSYGRRLPKSFKLIWGWPIFPAGRKSQQFSSSPSHCTFLTIWPYPRMCLPFKWTFAKHVPTAGHSWRWHVSVLMNPTSELRLIDRRMYLPSANGPKEIITSDHRE